MRDRYRLRFQTGDREGEEVALSSATVTLGRKPGNTIQVADASVSGRHAEIAVDAGGAILRDLGSTNGTRVGRNAVTADVRLAHGDEIVLGNVHLRFLDAELADAAPAPAAPAAPGGEELHAIAAEKLERTRRRSLPTLAAVVVLAAGAGYAALRFLGGESAGPGARRPVAAVAGNLLAESYSFEETGERAGDAGWEADLDAPAAFVASASAAWSGASGLSAVLAADEWALHRSPAVAARGGLSLTARARATGGARARLGLEYESSTGAGRPAVAWSPVPAGDGFDEVEVPGAVPPGYDRVRALVLASAGAEAGDVEVDDVALVPEGAGPAPLAVGEYQLAVAPTGDVASLFKIDRVFLGGLSVAGPGGPRAARARLAAETVADGFRLTVSGAPDDARLVLVAEPVVAGQVATLGPEGFRRRRADFEDEPATSVLFGRGVHQVALAFAEPVPVAGGPDGDAFRLAVGPGLPAELALQVSFAAQRGEAAGLARTARRAASEGRTGESLAAWERLLDEYPFEETLVSEATERRAELLRGGLEELGRVRAEIERAEFFGLPELYRQCRADLLALAADYADTTVAAECAAEVEAMSSRLAALESELDAVEVGRLREIRAMLGEAEMPRLAARVDEYLLERYGVSATEVE